MRKRSSETGDNRRLSSIPFIIHLQDEPYVLTRTELLEQVDKAVQLSRKWFYPSIQLISFEGATVTLQLSDTPKIQVMTVVVEQDRLHLSCDCNQPVTTICHHVFKALTRLMIGNQLRYFEQFSPMGMVEMANRYPQYFKKEKPYLASDDQYMPNEAMGTVYRLSENGRVSVIPVLSMFPDSVAHVTREKELCFVILTSHRKMRLPSLISCSGLLNKTGDEIKQFDPFLAGFEKKQYVFTVDQQKLAALGLSMWKLVQLLPGSLMQLTDQQTTLLEQLFHLWEQAVPLLCLQPFLYQYRLYKTKDLTARPVKTYLTRCVFSKDRPVLRFVVLDRGDFYLFYPELVIRGQSYRQFNTEYCLIICIDNKAYLPSSLKDAVLLERMEPMTVFKEHFQDFVQTILDPLQSEYPVHFLS